jgi:hypothetical protein
MNDGTARVDRVWEYALVENPDIWSILILPETATREEVLVFCRKQFGFERVFGVRAPGGDQSAE